MIPTTAPTLETERLILRAPATEDEAAFIEFFGSDRAQYVGGPLIPLRASMLFMGEIGHWATRGFGLWTVQWKGETAPIGMIGGFYPDTWPEKEIGWLLFDPSVEGQGIAFEAAQAARAYLYDTLKWPTAVSYIAEENARSIALAERLGAVLDPDAPIPGHSPCLVYRHPSPEALA